MAKNTTNQERGRKYGGSSSFVDAGQPSRAPRQDEDGSEAAGSKARQPGPADGDSPLQGISNRPANEEHAFPEPDTPGESTEEDRDSVEGDSKQLGGNRGRV
jgi:hypothetical protein